MQDVELLQFVYKTAEMGAKSLDDLKPSVRDPRLREAVGRQTREYREISAATPWVSPRAPGISTTTPETTPGSGALPKSSSRPRNGT